MFTNDNNKCLIEVFRRLKELLDRIPSILSHCWIRETLLLLKKGNHEVCHFVDWCDEDVTSESRLSNQQKESCWKKRDW